MKKFSSEIKLYMDELIIQTALSDKIIKTADFTEMIKNFISPHINSKDKIGSIINILGPAVVQTLFSSMGFGGFGILLGILTSAFDFDFSSVLSSIGEKLKSSLSGDNKITPTQVDTIVSTEINNHLNQPVQLESQNFNQQMRQARMIRFGLMYYNKSLNKYAAITASNAPTLLTSALSWLFKLVLKSAGLMLLGSGVKTLINPSSQSSATIVSTQQTKFKSSGGIENKNIGKDIWVENIPNNRSSIEDLVVKFSKEVYPGLKNLDNIIKSTEGFKETVDKILWYNRSSSGDNIVFIPNIFTSKKVLVDPFIDEVAQKAP